MFKKKRLEEKNLLNKAKKYKKILEESKVLPKNSFEMFRVIKKAGL